MPDVGAPELMLVLLISLFVFGGSKVAEIGGSLGKGIKEFKGAMREDETLAAVPAAVPVALSSAATLGQRVPYAQGAATPTSSLPTYATIAVRR